MPKKKKKTQSKRRKKVNKWLFWIGLTLVILSLSLTALKIVLGN